MQTRHRLFTLLWEALCGLEETGMELRRTQLSQMLQVDTTILVFWELRLEQCGATQSVVDV